MRLLNVRVLGVFVLSLFMVGSVQAQTTKMDLTLSKAIEIALDENPTIKIANMDIERAEYVVKETKSSLYPTVEGDLSYAYNLMLPVMFMPDGIFGEGTGGAMSYGYSHSYTGSVTASAPIYSAAMFKSIKLTEEQLLMSLETARSSKINMIKEVRSSYYGILLAQKSLEVLNGNKELLEKSTKDIENKFKQGIVSEYDLLSAQVQLQNLLPSIDKAKVAVEISHYMLKVLLSLPPDVELSLIEDLEDLSKTQAIDAGLNDTELKGNSDLRLIDHQIKLYENQYSLSRANRLPSFFASFNLSTTTQDDTFKFGQYEWAQSSYFALGVKIPIFAGLKNNHKDKQIQIDINKAKLNQSYLEANLNMQARSIKSNIFSALSQIESNKKAIEQATKTYKISETRYNVGAGTILELNSSQVAQMQAELSLNQAIYDLLTAYSEYDKLIGNDN